LVEEKSSVNADLEKERTGIEERLAQAKAAKQSLETKLIEAQTRQGTEAQILEKQSKIASNTATIERMQNRLTAEKAIRDAAYSEKVKSDLKTTSAQTDLDSKTNRVRSSKLQTGAGYAGFFVGAAAALTTGLATQLHLADHPEADLQSKLDTALKAIRESKDAINHAWTQIVSSQ
jgi:hypothetical protein